MNEEIIKKIAEEEFINNTMKHLDSALIFVYIKNLEKENVELNRMCEIYSQSLYNADLKKAEQEIDRLNNIINELEELCDKQGMYGEVAFKERFATIIKRIKG